MTNPPHETLFQYEDALISSCASSRLAINLTSRGEDGGGVGVVADSHITASSNHDHEQLRQEKQQHRHHRGAVSDCRELFDQHAHHYLRPPLSEEEKIFWDAWVNGDNDATPNNHMPDLHANNKFGTISPRIEAFLHSVLFVHQHNNDNDNEVENQHTVALNRFSDMLSHELPLMSHDASSNGNDDTSSFLSLFGHGATGGLKPRVQAALLDSLPENHHQGAESVTTSKGQRPVFVPLDDDESILKFGTKIRQMQQLTHQQRQDKYQQSNTVNNLAPDPAAHVSKLQSLRDSWWWIGGGHTHGNQHLQDQADANPLSRHSHHSNSKKNSKPKNDSYLLDKENELSGLEEKQVGINDESSSSDGDNWSHYLNWATDENPDGVSVVHPVIDQRMCGSCWAISATGTLEASIARNMAYIAYEDAYAADVASHKKSNKGDSSHKSNKGSSSNKNSPSTTEDSTMFAVLAAQEIERQSIQTADLSVQELVDCDTRYDQGCAGGNPLLAFYFLHRYGITSRENYPYTGKMGSCNYQKVDQPIATVETWGILTPDHENNMEKVLRYIGPVAVGMIGGDPAFLGYQTGVFMSSKGGKCDSGQADHAVLITGYGEEVSKDGKVVKYWIARNSWGSGWGENGYVRMARLGGKKGHSGVCGIARSPSVALGGMFTEDVVLDKSGVYGSTLSGESPYSNGGNRDSHESSTITSASSQIQNVMHRIRLRLGFAQKGIVMTTMDENENSGNVGVALMVIGMLLVCLSLATLYLQWRRDRQRKIQRQPSSEEESIATNNWSTIGVYNGVHEDISPGGISSSKGSSSGSDGERMHLLENSSGSLYT